MPSKEFSRICRDLSQIGDTVEIACTKNGVQFKTEGENGSGKVMLKQSVNADKEEDNVSAGPFILYKTMKIGIH